MKASAGMAVTRKMSKGTDHWPREFPSSAIIGKPEVVSNLAVWHKNAQPLNKKIEHTTENAAFVDNKAAR